MVHGAFTCGRVFSSVGRIRRLMLVFNLTLMVFQIRKCPAEDVHMCSLPEKSACLTWECSRGRRRTKLQSCEQSAANGRSWCVQARGERELSHLV